MLHSGSRGVGNLIAHTFIELARRDMERVQANLPDVNLAYLREGSEHFDDYIRAVECRKDKQVLDETPMAYKDIDAVMAAQSDLVEVVHTLKQVVCVKG